MNNLTQRIITATLGAAIIIGCILWNVYSFCAILFLLSFAVHFEYLKTIQQFKEGNKKATEWILNLLIGLYIFLVFVFPFFDTTIFGIADFISLIIFFFPILSLLFIHELFLNRKQPFQNIGLNIGGVFYCVIPFALIALTAFIPADKHDAVEDDSFVYEPWLVLGYFFIVWSNDVFAYFTGKLLGKHKLFERISPNKTWEGFAGGMLAGLICAFGLSYFFDFISRTDWLVIALIVAVFGTLGDLTESMLKRSVQLKDSSSILPGHGGFLDRFDATLIAAPFVFVYLMFRL